MDEIVSERRGALAVVRINRPDALNAFTREMVDAIEDAVLAAEADPGVIAIAVTGTGRAFSSGLDAAALAAVSEAGSAAAQARDPENPALFSSLLKVGKPVIAALNGVAAGGGVVLAAMCDLRFAGQSASFTTIFAKRGLIAEHAMSWLLPRIVGPSRALDLLWSSRKVGAEEALRIGLVDRVVPDAELLDAVQAYADDLAANVSPTSMAVIKAQVYRDLAKSFKSAAQEAERLKNQSFDHPDPGEGVKAFLERRPPRFAPYKPG